MKALLIPLKDPDNAKTRLSSFATAEQRRLLAWAMFEDVVEAASKAEKPDRVVLVSNCRPAIEYASTRGWDVLIEYEQQSESASIDRASRILAETGFDRVMRLPADLPLVRAEDIDELLSIDLKSPGAVLVPSFDGTGTNAIIRTPPALFPSRFGPNSLELHKQEASHAGIECVVYENERIAFDVDEPSDVHRLLELGFGTRAHVIAERLILSAPVDL
ncbi:MAG TPA: 2-phospho-L-lactate guanylyltransferase [Blastocatellia bacterium]|nr:2-phospho-L-lactate guanylyltransferase [Blastocatellia bacterium]